MQAESKKVSRMQVIKRLLTMYRKASMRQNWEHIKGIDELMRSFELLDCSKAKLAVGEVRRSAAAWRLPDPNTGSCRRWRPSL